MTTVLDGHALAARFPVLQRRLDDQPVVYLDSANTSQKLMRWRVGLQGIAIVVLMAALYFTHR